MKFELWVAKNEVERERIVESTHELPVNESSAGRQPQTSRANKMVAVTIHCLPAPVSLNTNTVLL